MVSVTISDNVVSMGDCAFRECTSLTSFYGKLASADNRCIILNGILHSFAPAGLTTYIIPNSVTSIGNRTFSFCDSLISITIPDSVTSIGKGAFSYCKNLTSVTIGNSVTSIGEDAFSDCISLTSVTIPNSVTLIGSMAFYECSNLTSVTIGNSVSSIGSMAFGYCSSLTKVYCKPIVPPTLDNRIFSVSDIPMIYVPEESVYIYKKSESWYRYSGCIYADSNEN